MAPEFVMMLLLTASIPVSTLLMAALLVMMLPLPARIPDDCGPTMGAVLLMTLLLTPELSKNVKVSKDENPLFTSKPLTLTVTYLPSMDTVA